MSVRRDRDQYPGYVPGFDQLKNDWVRKYLWLAGYDSLEEAGQEPDWVLLRIDQIGRFALKEIRQSLACGPSGSVPEERPLARRTDPETSHEAGKGVREGLGRSQAWLLSKLHSWVDGPTGFTDKQLVKALLSFWLNPPKGLRTGSGVRTRRLELARAGLLELVAEDGSGVAYREDGQYDVKLKKRERSLVWRLK